MNRYANAPMAQLFLARIDNKKLTGLITLMALTSDVPGATGFHTDGMCQRSDAPASDSRHDEELSDQRCWAVLVDDVNSWRAPNASPVFKSALAELDNRGITLPRWMAFSYHRVADKNRLWSIRYLVDPELYGVHAKDVPEMVRFSKYHLTEISGWANVVDKLAAWSKTRSEHLGTEFQGASQAGQLTPAYSWPPK
jgi:hypothetical protein